jgi:transposase
MVGKKTKNKAVGISKGGRNTKIHVIVDGLGNPISFLLSAGNEHDSKHAIPLLKQVEVKGSNILGDRAYNAKEIALLLIKQAILYFQRRTILINELWIVISTRSVI